MRYRTLLLLLLLIVPSFVAAQVAKSQYIGYSYEGVKPSTQLPNGVKHLGGGLLGDIEAETVYGVSEVQLGKTKMLWLEESTGKDATGITGWKVLDVLSFSMLARSRYVFFHGDPAIGCRRRREKYHIQNLVGEGRVVRARSSFIPSNLWVANLETKKFEPLSVTGVRCEYSEP